MIFEFPFQLPAKTWQVPGPRASKLAFWSQGGRHLSMPGLDDAINMMMILGQHGENDVYIRYTHA